MEKNQLFVQDKNKVHLINLLWQTLESKNMIKYEYISKSCAQNFLPIVFLTCLRRKRVIHENIWPRCVWSKGPDRPGSQQIPVVLRLEELSQLLPAMTKQDSYWLGVGK